MSRWRTVVRNYLKEWQAEHDRSEVTLQELREYMGAQLEKKFPNNDNIDAGLRRTLQELRDEDDLEFLGNGEYRLALESYPDVDELFETALREYPEARDNDDFDHQSAKLIKDEIPRILDEVLSFDHLTIRGSVGYGGLANIPWIGIFDERITSDPKDGLYIVYLFDTGRNSVFLTLNQGMTHLQDEFGRSAAREILSTRAELLRAVGDIDDFEEGQIPLTSDLLTAKNNLYGTSSIYHREYSLDGIPESSVWIDEVSRLVEEYQRLIDENVYSELLDAFDDTTGEQQDPFEDGPDLPPPVDEYDGVDEATEDVLNRIEIADGEIETFRSELSKAVISEWTDPLKKIAVQTASEITTDEAVLIRQIQTIYEKNEDWLSARAAELGIGSLFALDPSQVLYMALLRDIQSEVADVSELNINHVKLKTIFNQEYTVQTPEADSDPSLHPIRSHLAEHRDDVEVHTFTAPPDYWLTALRYRAVSFEEEYRTRWEQLSEGDIALFHSTAEPGNPELGEQPNGFIGAAILGRKARKSEDWWWDEFESGDAFPLVVGFERVYTTASIDKIEQTLTIDQQSDVDIELELEAITNDLLPYRTADEACREETGDGLNPRGAFSTFDRDDERQDIILANLAPSLSEISPVNLHLDVSPVFESAVLEGLYFPENEGETILGEIQAAIRSGKHVVLTGPPGTGKTEIAERIADELAEAYPYLYSGAKVTTATSDWSTFDTVGGYMPSESGSDSAEDSLSFKPGTILNRLRHSQFDVPINEPLVIDELNRADIDKAFGQLFTVLSGQSVSLPYTRMGQEIELLSAEDLDGFPRQHQFVIPRSWRLLATMNTYDKTSLYEMSYAFMRRFAFIRVGAPDLDGDLLELMQNYTAAWEEAGLEISLREDELRAIGRVWRQTNSAVDERAIGPAIARDLVLYLQNHAINSLEANLTDAVIAYIFPQLEGVPKRRQIVDNIGDVPEIDEDRLRDVGREMLQIRFDEVEGRG
ncbi:MAG: MrcB family domain-containing protein [Halobacteriales archaeon]